MKNEDLKELLKQIKKYDLAKYFQNPEEFDNWLKKLNKRQIKNLNSLTIDTEKVKIIKNLLINEDLLNCNDFNDKVLAMTNLKCEDKYTCSKNFLNSKHFYDDIKILSKITDECVFRQAVLLLSEKNFTNSKYHKEDLELIANVKNKKNKKGYDMNFLVAQILSEVANNAESIKSPYHKQDMNLIANADVDSLQSPYSYPYSSVNNLAVDSNSLNDKYHLENMKLLKDNPTIDSLLYMLMTDPNIIKGKHYRDEINAIVNSKDLLNAIAVYFYIVEPNNDYSCFIIDSFNNFWCKIPNYIEKINDYISKIHSRNKKVENKKNQPDYLKNLKLLGQIDYKKAPFIESLLSNPDFAKSKYKENDIKLLLSNELNDTFLKLYFLMKDENSLSGIHHINDLNIISTIKDENKLNLLFDIAKDKYSINSKYHEYDMNYAAELDINKIDKDIFDEMIYYLLRCDGINHPKHVEKLEKLLKGELTERQDSVVDYVEYLENSIDTNSTRWQEEAGFKIPNTSKIKGILKFIKDLPNPDTKGLQKKSNEYIKNALDERKSEKQLVKKPIDKNINK